MNRHLIGILLALASSTAMGDCKQDCRDAYAQCSQDATSLDMTMRCKTAYKECVAACNASGLAANAADAAAKAGAICAPVAASEPAPASLPSAPSAR